MIDIDKECERYLKQVLLAAWLESRAGPKHRRAEFREVFVGDLCSKTVEKYLEAIPGRYLRQAESELRVAEVAGDTVITRFQSSYPSLLRNIPDAPLLLFVRGKLEPNFGIAVVGSRRSSSYGKRVARELAEDLTLLGASVVSGLAFGIDAAAHRGALAATMGLSSRSELSAGVAVLGSGLGNLYPSEHRELGEQIAEYNGAIVSEYPPSTPPLKAYFPERNRIISGLCEAVVVVEAGEKSGSRITARLALEQGREVFAVPGPIDSKWSSGTNQLISQGAVIFRSVDDLFAELPQLLPKIKKSIARRKKKEQFGGDLEGRIRGIIERERSVPFDELVQKTGCEPADLQARLVQMELSGILSCEPGQIYTLGNSPSR